MRRQGPHQDASGGVRVPGPEARVDPRHRCVPVEAALVDETGQQEGGERLGVRRDQEEAIGGHPLPPAPPPNPQTPPLEAALRPHNHPPPPPATPPMLPPLPPSPPPPP